MEKAVRAVKPVGQLCVNDVTELPTNIPDIVTDMWKKHNSLNIVLQANSHV